MHLYFDRFVFVSSNVFTELMTELRMTEYFKIVKYRKFNDLETIQGRLSFSLDYEKVFHMCVTFFDFVYFLYDLMEIFRLT